MVTERSLTLRGYFDVVGRQASKTHVGFFTVTNDVRPTVELLAAGRRVVNPSKADYKRLTPRPVSGVLRSGNQLFTNTKLEFIAHVDHLGLTASVVAASTTTDRGGRYVVWLESGEYDLVVHARTGELRLNNIKVSSKLGQLFTTRLTGLIHSKTADVVTFNGSDLVLTRGAIVDANGLPVAGARVVVTADEQLLAYCVTAEDGLYEFALPRGTCDVQLRGVASPAKIVTGVVVDGQRGFAEQLCENSITFGRQALVLA